MATYKVIQDIEAEDKILGPLTLKQFVFAFVDIIMIFAAVRLFTIQPVLVLILLPFIITLTALALPLGRDQPTEVWLLAKIRYFLKPHRRVWDPSGVSQQVTINAPKREAHQFTDGLSKNEVRSRLTALANTLDSRGWAVKNVNVNLYSQPDIDDAISDRLVESSSLPQQVPTIGDITAEDDMMDAESNPLARNMDSMIRQRQDDLYQQAAVRTREAAQTSDKPQVAPDYYFMRQPPAVSQEPLDPSLATFASQTLAPGQDDTDITALAPNTAELTAEQELLKRLHEQNSTDGSPLYSSHMKRLDTPEEIAKKERQAADAAARAKASKKESAASQRPPNPAIMSIAKDSDDLKVSTVASLAKHIDEVVITLR